MIFATLKFNHKVKHLNMRIQFIRELIQDGTIAIHFVPTKFNMADMLLRNILMKGHGGHEPSSTWAAQTTHFALTVHSIEENKVKE
jgi:uncharacterized membrane protein